MSDLRDIILALVQRLSDLERRTAGQQWRGKVAEVNPAEGTARIILGQDEDGNDVLSPPLPYAQNAGALKLHSPPSVGQQMEVQSQGGDIEQGTLRPLHWSNENTQPSQSGNEHVLTFGGARVELRGQDMKITIPKLVIEAGGGTLTLENGTATFSGFNRVEHDGRNIGKGHTHGGIVPGPASTLIPNP